MNQYLPRVGLKNFKKRVTTAVSEELQQLRVYEEFSPMDSINLTTENKQKALEPLMFLEEKRYGLIK